MRTTIRISDELYRQVKQRALDSDRTIGDIIEAALRTSFAAYDARPTELPPLPTAGGDGVRPGVDLTSNAALLEIMDEGVQLDALR